MSKTRSQRIASSDSWMRRLLAWALDYWEVSSSSRLLKPMCLTNDMMQSKSWAWRRTCSFKLDKVQLSLAPLFLGTDCDCYSPQVFRRYWKAPYQCLSSIGCQAATANFCSSSLSQRNPTYNIASSPSTRFSCWKALPSQFPFCLNHLQAVQQSCFSSSGKIAVQRI